MWHNHPFSQQNKATEREMGVGIGADREGGGGLLWLTATGLEPTST